MHYPLNREREESEIQNPCCSMETIHIEEEQESNKQAAPEGFYTEAPNG